MAVQEGELSAAAVEIGMDKVRRTDAGNILGVKKPNNGGRISDLAQSDLGQIVGAGAVMLLIQAVVKKIETTTTTFVAGANPN